MKTTMIAALVAAQLSAAATPARATEAPGEEPAAQHRIEESVEIAAREAPAPAVEDTAKSARALAAREDEPRKRKSTGDKVLTGAAIVLGIGALAVGGLLIAIFAN